MNYVHVIGRLGRDPEVRYTSDNKKVTTLVVASNYVKGGQQETIWWRVSFWGDRWDKMISYLSKGKPVMFGGEMRKPETYVDKNGQTQLGSIDVQGEYLKFLPYGSKEESTGDSQAGAQKEPSSYGSSSMESSSFGSESGAAAFAAVDDEALPF